MSEPNKILDASNNALGVTNLLNDDATRLTLSGIPLGTAGASATGELGVKTISVGGSGSSSTTPSFVEAKQYTASSVPAIATTNATVFTLTAGQKGIIQNLDDAALAVRYGASCSTTVFNFILRAGSAADDGNGPILVVDDWVGVVSVCAMSGTARYIATVLS